MEKIISACGNDCSVCPRYTKEPFSKSAEELKHTAELWYKIGYRKSVVSIEEISCDGCKIENWCRYEIVKCTTEKSIENCGQCKNYPCEKIKNCFEVTKSFESACKKNCSEKEFEIMKKAFFEKEKNLSGVIMTEWEKAQAGFLYDANYESEIIKLREKCADLCWEFNNCKPSDVETQKKLIHKIIGKIKGNITVTAPFFCDYGINISVGENFYTNHNVTILDGAKVTFGDNVFIAPNCVFSTAGHPFDVEQRNKGLEIALPISVGDNVWIGTQVSVLPGVKIGSNTIIGAGSVVNKDIPDGVVAAGNPCRVIRKITEDDKNKYPIFK